MRVASHLGDSGETGDFEVKVKSMVNTFYIGLTIFRVCPRQVKGAETVEKMEFERRA